MRDDSAEKARDAAEKAREAAGGAGEWVPLFQREEDVNGGNTVITPPATRSTRSETAGPSRRRRLRRPGRADGYGGQPVDRRRAGRGRGAVLARGPSARRAEALPDPLRLPIAVVSTADAL